MFSSSQTLEEFKATLTLKDESFNAFNAATPEALEQS